MRILFVTSNRLGDAVLSTGVLGALMDRHPHARFTVVAGPIPSPLFETAPQVDRVVPMAKRKRAGHWLHVWRSLIGTRFDKVVDLRESGLGYVLGCFRVHRSVTKKPGQHAVEEAATILDLDPVPTPRLWISNADRQTARELTGQATHKAPLLIIGPTANFAGKQWPIDRFKDLAQRLTSADGPCPDASIGVLGAAHERDQALPLLKDPALSCIDLVGKPSLGVVAALLEQATLYVGNDSGLMHMAAALNRPTLGIFGPSDPDRYSPYGAHAAAVLPTKPWLDVWRDFFERGMPAEEVMQGVSVDAAYEAACSLLQAREDVA